MTKLSCRARERCDPDHRAVPEAGRILTVGIASDDPLAGTVRLRGGARPDVHFGETDMSDKLTPDNVFVEDGGETYEDLVNLDEDDG